ncbi:hypothetical protein Tco_0805176 [Tanacetum coccineum]
MGTVRFGNDHVAAILGYGNLQWGNILIAWVYFAEGLRHNLFSVRQFCDSDLEGKSKTTPHKPKPVPKLKEEVTPASYGFVWVNESQKYKWEVLSLLRATLTLCYPKNDCEDIGKLGAKGDIGFFIGYSANSYAYRVYN